MLIPLGIGNFITQVCIEDAKEYFQNTETCYNKTFATQNKPDSGFVVGFYIENTLYLKYQNRIRCEVTILMQKGLSMYSLFKKKAR